MITAIIGSIILVEFTLFIIFTTGSIAVSGNSVPYLVDY